MQDLLATRAVRERGIYNVDMIMGDLQRHRSGRVDVAQGLFNVAQFEILAALSNDAPLHMPLNRKSLPPTPAPPELR